MDHQGEPLRILQVSSAKEIGGGETHLVTLVRGLTARGHSVSVAVRPNSPLPERLPDYQFFTVPLRNSLDIFSARQLAQIVKREKIDILHCHYGRDYMIGAMATKLAGRVSLILTRHVPFPMKNNIGYRKALRIASRMICVSESVRQETIKGGLFNPEKLVTIYNGIEIERFSHNKPSAREDIVPLRRGLGLPADPEITLVGVVGQLAEHKGQADFLEAAAIITKNNPSIQFVVSGKDHSSDQHYKNRLDFIVANSGLSDRVTFIDDVDDMPLMLAALDVLVMPSHQESFGLVLVEAMASATNVIATDIGGPREIVENEKTGLLVKSQRPAEIADAVFRLIEDSELTRALAENAKSVVAERFSAEKMVAATEHIYLDAINTQA
ncbi:MAG TPA: glycosyltransferase family 4 protein [Blastocatellia bacterium]|nr:glycosyltransferase family 4 protein [Blastocatellia bacterium]